MNQEQIQMFKYASTHLNILYVEDDSDAREATLLLLNEFFTHITIAVDGSDGYEKFSSGKHDLIITDINMPKMNGIDLITKIRQKNRNIPILVLSAYNESRYLLETIKLGIDGYLLKPLDLNQFLESITKVITTIRLKEENETYRDSLEKKVEERTAQLLSQIYHDQLTGLKNQTALLIDFKKKPGGMLILVDIDAFQSYNDFFGISSGNEILIAFAACLQKFAEKKSYELYRVYGDGFVLYAQTSPADNGCDALLNELLEQLMHFTVRLDILEDDLDIDATVGIACNEGHLLEKAEMAMKHAKESHKPYMIYSAEFNASEVLKNEIHWRKKIKKALSEEEGIIPVFQPILNRNRETTKYEVLMRMSKMENGERRLITPFHFLDIAKKTKYYKQMTETIIEKSFQYMQHLPYDFSINLSFEDIQEHAFTQHLEEAINRYGVHERLILEIVESEHIPDYHIVKEFIKYFQSIGVRIAIDDFGSGYSNFSHIFELRPDFIKIDGSLIKDIPTNKELLVLVKAIISFSKELNIRVIAEFVASEEIFNILYELGIDEFQGYYFAQPHEHIPEKG